MKVEVIQAWPGRFEAATVELSEGACVADAVAAAKPSAMDAIVGYAVFGVLAAAATPLRDGDRVELLRGLQADPKEARRQRARKKQGGHRPP